jgi:hypothetical protein
VRECDFILGEAPGKGIGHPRVVLQGQAYSGNAVRMAHSPFA